MSLKRTILITACSVVLVLAACIALIAYNLETRAWRPSEADARAAALGRSAAIVVAVTLAPLWIYWAARHRKARMR